MGLNTSDADYEVLLNQIVNSTQAWGWNVASLVLYQATAAEIIASTDPGLQHLLPAEVPDALHPQTWRHEHLRISQSYLTGEQSVSAQSATTWQAGDQLFIPLGVNDQEVGWLIISEPDSGLVPTEADVQLLETLARQAAMTIQQAQLQQAFHRQFLRQRVLNEIAHTISQYLDLAELFEAITS
ncbi:MAG: GAF domain-containing protein [Chloroflexi bacterium]|nr:GAF domain-containing protein [Chloroflexota bacterium]